MIVRQYIYVYLCILYHFIDLSLQRGYPEKVSPKDHCLAMGSRQKEHQDGTSIIELPYDLHTILINIDDNEI